MTREDLTAKILKTKLEKALTWEAIAKKAKCSTIYCTAALLGQATLTAAQAKALTTTFKLTKVEVALLQVPPNRGSLGEAVPTDPLIYRFYEIVQVYGTTLKELIQEEFGDGIMSAIDYTMDIQREKDPKGDRVVVTLNGKFLPYKRF